MSEYKPYLIARISTVLSNGDARLATFLDYDYMGSSEFEFGAIPKSLARMRLVVADSLYADAKSDGMEIRNFPQLTSSYGNYSGNTLHVLASTATFDKFGDSLLTALTKLSSGDRRCKERTEFDKCFLTKAPLWESQGFDIWHDIDHDIFFTFSPAVLVAIRAHLNTPISVTDFSVMSTSFHIGDDIEGIFPKKGKIDERVRHSAENWQVVAGKVAGIFDDYVVIKKHGKSHHVPWYLVTSKPTCFQLPDIERLRELVNR